MTDVEGIVIRQVRTTGARRMVTVFTREEGKVGAGTYLSESGKSRAALALRPFAHGKYRLAEKAGGVLSIAQAEVVDAHFGIGQDADRFAEASFALEFTDRLLPERVKAGTVFGLLAAYLCIIEKRKKDFRLPTLAYMVQVMRGLGVFPDAGELAAELRVGANDDILECTVFLMENPLERTEGLSLAPDAEDAVFAALRRFAREHLDVGELKSEKLIRRN
ncbi:MAG: DNA repair protein RecO [Clostridiales Family XIII bacterium]|jgi:DNA repair protein RecO (recombination protein O)|nr:DNA repair protein RecO [Clostridiales Family XIII bacterium]